MTTLGIILAFLPSFAWLFFYLREDLHPEPKKLLALTFVYGIIFAFLALFAEGIINIAFSRFRIADTAIFAVILFAAVEEFFKFAAAYSAVHKNPAFNEPVDAMIYAIVAGLGFAALENFGALNLVSGEVFLPGRTVETASLRFVGATLLHSLTAGVIGYWWAMSIRSFGSKKLIIRGLILASGLHAVFNYLIIIFGSIIYPVILLVTVGFFVLNDFENLKEKSV